MLEHALAYAARGWPVFPCHPENKRPLVGGDIDPATGFEIPNTGGLKKATTDVAQIRAWWGRWPRAMVGIPTGAAIGANVIDLDLGDPQLISGKEYLERLIAHVGGIPHTAIAETASGGLHIYLATDLARPVRNGARVVPALSIAPAAEANGGKAKGAGIDLRGEGGYVIAPPSIRADGRAYSWLQPIDDGIAEPTPRLWDVLLKKEAKPERPASSSPSSSTNAPSSSSAGAGDVVDLAVRRYALSAFDAEIRRLELAPDGTRNATINEVAFKLGQLIAANAISETVVRSALRDVVRRWPNPEKSDGTIERGLAAGMADPRDLNDVRSRAQARSETRQARPSQRPRSDLDLDLTDDAGVPPRLPPASAPGDDPPAAMASAAGAAGAPGRDPPAPSTTGTIAILPVGGSSRNGGGRRADADRGAGGRSDRDDALDRELADVPMTDLGNVERFVERNRGKLLYCPALGWLWWDGRRWSRDGADARVRLAEHEAVRRIQDEADAIRGARHDHVVRIKNADKKNEEVIRVSDELAAWGRMSESANHINPLSKHAGAYLYVDTAHLDADPLKFNVENGTLVFSRDQVNGDFIRFKPHDPDDLITKLAPVKYDAAALCPLYDEFLAYAQPKAENVKFLHQWGGYNLTGDVSEQKLSFFWGKGKNGKSTLVDAWAYVAGDYGKTSPIESFLTEGKGRNAGQATPDLAMLQGVRFLRTSEPEQGAKLAEAFVKLITGGEPFAVRELNMPYFMLSPQFKLTMSGNYRPKISGADEGIWRRVNLVPWVVTVPEEKRDRLLPEKLRREASGILNRLLDGLRDWFANGLSTPDDVAVATSAYRRDSDPLGRFLEACTEPAKGERVQAMPLHQLWVAWATANSATAWTAKGFANAMIERGFQSKHSNVNWWLDLRATKTVNDFVDNDGKPLVQRNAKAGEADDDGDLSV